MTEVSSAAPGRVRGQQLALARVVFGVLIAAVLAVALVTAGNSRAWPLTIDIGGQDARFVQHIHEPETFGERSARWTTGDTHLIVPRAAGGGVLSLWLLQSRPEGQPDPQIRVTVDDRLVGTFVAQRSTGGFMQYRVPIPDTGWLTWGSHVALDMDPITLAADPRPLGVVLDRVQVEPLQAVPLPSAWLALCAAAFGALVYALGRLLGLREIVALAGVALASGLLAWGVAVRPLELLPFVQRLVMLLALAVAGTGALAWHQRRNGGQGIDGALLPLVLAAVWWFGPLYQLLMTLDGAVNVTPNPMTLWVGAGLLLALGIIGALSARLSMEQRRTALLAVFALGALAHLATMIQFAFTRSGPDFWILFKGAREWARGGSLYDLDAVMTNHFGHVFKVPPFYGMLFLPWVFQDGMQILFFHRVLNVLLLALTALAWYRMWGLRLLAPAGLGFLVILNFRPLADTIAFGQIDLALLCILTLALWALRNERDMLAGVLVALGTLFKIYPLLLLALFVVKRQWRALGGFALGMLLFNGAAVAVMGWDMHRIYLTQVFPNIGGTTAWVENQTVSGVLSRLVATPTEAAILENRLISLLGLGISGLLGLISCVLVSAPVPRRSTAYALHYGLFLLLMVLVVPAAWMHYETLLVVPFGALLLHAQGQKWGIGRVALLAASFALIAYGNQWSYYDGTVMGVLTLAGVSYKFYGMVLLGGVLVVTLVRDVAWNWLPARFSRPRPAASALTRHG